MKEFTQINWHAIPAEEAAGLLESGPASGLTQAEAETRLRQFGPNQMTAQKRLSEWMRSALSASLFSNRWMLAGIVATWLAQILFTYLPFMNRLFHSAPVRAEAWLYIVAIGVFAFVVVEFEKWIRFRARRPAQASGI
jgi:cation-transporting ATPase F